MFEQTTHLRDSSIRIITIQVAFCAVNNYICVTSLQVLARNYIYPIGL